MFSNKPQYKSKQREVKPLTARAEVSTEIPPLTTTITTVLEVGIHPTQLQSHYRENAKKNKDDGESLFFLGV